MNKRSFRILIQCSIYIGLFFTATALSAQDQQDALKLYRNGRNLEMIGRSDDARKVYTNAIAICQRELEKDPHNIDAYSVYTWCLFRLHRYRETIETCNKALKIASDARIIETLGEAYFYTNDYHESMRHMEWYIEKAPAGERVSVAYFYMGDIYRITKRYQKADIAYSTAVHLEPGNSLWWYRLGLTREQAGQKKAALVAYERALSIRKEYKEANEAIKRLQL